MARMMMLVSEQGATMGESRLGGTVIGDSDVHARSDIEVERLLRDEALTSGFSEEEVRGAHVVIVGDV